MPNKVNQQLLDAAKALIQCFDSVALDDPEFAMHDLSHVTPRLRAAIKNAEEGK